MFTKKDYAEYILEKYAEDEGISVDDIKNKPDAHIFKSTKVGIALEQLGLLEGKKELKRYLSERAGVWLIRMPTKERPAKQMSTREFFSLLPEAI